ncbi:Protein MCM10 [Gossypium australe]|uniref:Protein MCM10 n=1 Tax=Gossypium australe TaxID=47621 RepID=A0A5B6WG24_9ROSI|nr:Protein MCM10 [Gossypium australe]
MDPERAVADDVESNASASAQGTTPSKSRLVSGCQGGEAKKVFFQMMNEWFTQYVHTNSAAQQPPPPPNPQSIPIAPQVVELQRLDKLPVDKTCKFRAEEFKATVDDDPEKAKFWLENTILVFDELSCMSAECLKYVISLLRDRTYQWWNTLVSIVPRERITWEFFQTEFRKKYISQWFLDQKHKEFLELKQGRMIVTEYKREFVWLSKYAPEYVSIEEIMSKRFVDELNEDIKLLVRILELKEFVVLVDRACKVDELSKEKKKADSEARDLRKRSMSKPYYSSSKKSKDYFNRSTTSAGYSNRDSKKQYTSPKAQATSLSSVGNNNEIIRIESDESSELPVMISSMSAKRCVRKGCEAYLAYVLDIKVLELKIESVPVVCEYSDVFPEELPRLLHIKEVEFAIELVSGTSLISIAPYRMAPTELKELKSQLEELTNRGFVQPSSSPWVEPVLFVKKKDGSMRMRIDYL